jgi:antitoxin CptB
VENQKSNIKNSKVDYKWQCRRGMLELDLLLNNFVDKGINTLSEKEIESFELLLSYPDQTLLDLLLGNSISSNYEISNLVQKIQETPFGIPSETN